MCRQQGAKYPLKANELCPALISGLTVQSCVVLPQGFKIFPLFEFVSAINL